MGEESEKKRNSILSCLESALGDLFLEIAAKIPIENIEHNICQETLGTFCSCRPSWPRTASNVTFSESNHLPQQVGQFAKKTPTTKYAILKINVSLIQQIFQGYVTNLYLKTTKTILSFYFQSNIRLSALPCTCFMFAQSLSIQFSLFDIFSQVGKWNKILTN